MLAPAAVLALVLALAAVLVQVSAAVLVLVLVPAPVAGPCHQSSGAHAKLAPALCFQVQGSGVLALAAAP